MEHKCVQVQVHTLAHSQSAQQNEGLVQSKSDRGDIHRNEHYEGHPNESRQHEDGTQSGECVPYHVKTVAQAEMYGFRAHKTRMGVFQTRHRSNDLSNVRHSAFRAHRPP